MEMGIDESRAYLNLYTIPAARIKTKVWEYAHLNVIGIRDVWKIIYKEYQSRTGVNPWLGRDTGIANIYRQVGHLDQLEAIIDEMMYPLEDL